LDFLNIFWILKNRAVLKRQQGSLEKTGQS
jgi:hypothetical protein